MAKIVEELVILKFSRIVKDNNANPESAISEEHIAALEQVAQELAGDSVVIEVERA